MSCSCTIKISDCTFDSTRKVLSFRWEDRSCYATIVVPIYPGMTLLEFEEQARMISGNGECSQRGFAELLTVDMSDLFSENGAICSVQSVADNQHLLRRRWKAREFEHIMQNMAVDNLSIDDAIDILRRRLVSSVMEQ